MTNTNATATLFVQHLHCIHHVNEGCHNYCYDENKQLTLSMLHLFAIISTMNDINGIYCAHTFIVMMNTVQIMHNQSCVCDESIYQLCINNLKSIRWSDEHEFNTSSTLFVHYSPCIYHHHECMCKLKAISVIHCADYCK